MVKARSVLLALRPASKAEGVCVFSAAALWLAAIIVPPTWRGVDPELHARWWYIYGGVEQPQPLLRSDRWLEIDVGYDGPGGSAVWADVRAVGSLPPARDPWGHPWEHLPPTPGFRSQSPGVRVVLDANGSEDVAQERRGLVWSRGPDGRWDQGGTDDILIDGPAAEVALLAVSRALLTTIGAAMFGALVAGRTLVRPPGPFGVVVTIGAAAIAWTPIGVAIESLVGSGALRSSAPWTQCVLPFHVGVHGSGVMGVSLLIACLRLSGAESQASRVESAR